MNKNQSQLMDDYGSGVFEGIGGSGDQEPKITGSIAFANKQIVTITSDNVAQNPALIIINDEASDKFILPIDRHVYVDGNELTNETGIYLYDDGEKTYAVEFSSANDVGLYVFEGSRISKDSIPAPGNYEVEIKADIREYADDQIAFVLGMPTSGDGKYVLIGCNKTPVEMHDIYERINNNISLIIKYKVIIDGVMRNELLMFNSTIAPGDRPNYNFDIVFHDQSDRGLGPVINNGEKDLFSVVVYHIDYAASKNYEAEKNGGPEYYNPVVWYNMRRFNIDATEVT